MATASKPTANTKILCTYRCKRTQHISHVFEAVDIMSYDIIFVFRSLRATNLSIEVEPEDIVGNYDKTHIYTKESKSILNGNSVFFPILIGERFGD